MATKVQRDSLSRKKAAFRAACDLAGKRQAEVATELGVHESHLSLVLGGRRESAALMERVERWTARVFAKHIPAAAEQVA